MNKRAILIACCLLPWAMACAGLGWLLIQRFPPSGTVSFDVPFDGRSAWINPFLPSERVTPPGAQTDGWRGQRILGDPVYTSARIPGVYDSVDVEVEFRPIRQTLLELGVLRDPVAFQFEFQPMWFAPIQNITWQPFMDHSREGYVLTHVQTGVVTQQKDGAIVSTTSSSAFDELAVWHASTTPLLRADPPAEVKTFRVSLRGAHDFYIVPSGDAVHMAFEVQDVNRASGSDTVVFRVFRGEEELSREAVGIGATHDQGMGPVIKKSIDVPQAASDIYHIQFIADDDVFIRAITTSAVHWVIGPRLVFGDSVGFSTSTPPGLAWSNSRHLVLETFHHEGLQEATFGSARVTLTKTHEPYPFDRTDAERAPQAFTAPHADIRLIGDGWFSLTPDAFFTPQPRRVTDATNPVVEGTKAILTPYERPDALEDGWYRTHLTFKLNPDQDTMRLALSAPGIIARSGAVDIRRIHLTYRRPPLNWSEWWRVVWLEARNAWRRLRS